MVRLAGLIALLGLMAASCGEKQDPYGSDAGVEGDVTYTEQIAPILDANCIRCHAADKQGASRNGAPVGFNYDTFDEAVATAGRANDQIQSGSMPVGGNLTAEEKAFFQAWVDQGTPE